MYCSSWGLGWGGRVRRYHSDHFWAGPTLMTGQCRPSRKRDFRNRPFFGKHHPTWPRRRRRRSPWMCNLAAMTRTQTESPSTLRAQRAEENAVNLSEQTGFQTVIPPSWQNGEPLPEHSQGRSAKLETFVVLVTCGSCFLDQKNQKKSHSTSP